tara:strand:+ start:1237 stop:1668 length:432 start_codon:yes stop_codon:yes gene_type:complete
MKITRRQLQNLLKETAVGMTETAALERLIKSGSPEHIAQAYQLAETLGINFEQIVTNMVKAANILETREVDNIIYQIDDILFTAQKVGLGMMGIDVDSMQETGVVHEDVMADIDMELAYSIKTHAYNAIERSIIQLIVAIAKK